MTGMHAPYGTAPGGRGRLGDPGGYTSSECKECGNKWETRPTAESVADALIDSQLDEGRQPGHFLQAKRNAKKDAAKRGHVLGPWHNTGFGAHVATCQDCHGEVQVRITPDYKESWIESKPWNPIDNRWREGNLSDLCRSGKGMRKIGDGTRGLGEAVTIADIRGQHKGHFFDPSTMKFFKSRVHGKAYEGPGGTYFVTSEQQPRWGGGHGRRRYTVRRYDQDKDTVRQHGEFLGYKHSRHAHGAAAQAALKAPKAKIGEAVDALLHGADVRSVIEASFWDRLQPHAMVVTGLEKGDYTAANQQPVRRQAPCECEHGSHFDSGGGHKYGDRGAEVMPSKTSMGTFQFCSTCRSQGHHQH